MKLLFMIVQLDQNNNLHFSKKSNSPKFLKDESLAS